MLRFGFALAFRSPSSTSWSSTPVTAALLVAGLGLSPATLAETAIALTDVAEAAGLSGESVGPFRSAGNHGLGVNWIDIDRDGWPDLFAVGGEVGSPSHLFRNLGDGTFQQVDEWLGPLPDVETSGSRFADYDRDGDLDLYLYTDHEDFGLTQTDNPQGGPPNVLLQNQWMERGETLPGPGEVLFLDVSSAAGVDDLAVPALGDLPAYRSKTASWLDYDRDGCVDLYVGHLVMNAGGQPANADRLYRNLCDGTFEDATVATGLYPADPTGLRSALASGGFHLNDDLWPDLAVINISYWDAQPYIDDQFFLNSGVTESSPALGAVASVTFTDLALTQPWLGDDAQAGMGVDVGDLDLDGDWDVYISDKYNTVLDEMPAGNPLYLGDGAGGFEENSAEALGVQGFDSWGVNFVDLDLDGWEDIFVATVVTEVLYQNLGVGPGGLAFAEISGEVGIVTGNSRGSAVADYDRDGDPDIVLVNQFSGLQLFRNDSATAGHHWLGLHLTGRESSLDAIGTIVEVEAGGVTRRRQVKGGSSAHSQDDLAVLFGLGAATQVDALRVRWLSGRELVLENLPVDRYLELSEDLLFLSGFETGSATSWDVVVAP